MWIEGRWTEEYTAQSGVKHNTQCIASYFVVTVCYWATSWLWQRNISPSPSTAHNDGITSGRDTAQNSITICNVVWNRHECCGVTSRYIRYPRKTNIHRTTIHSVSQWNVVGTDCNVEETGQDAFPFGGKLTRIIPGCIVFRYDTFLHESLNVMKGSRNAFSIACKTLCILQGFISCRTATFDNNYDASQAKHSAFCMHLDTLRFLLNAFLKTAQYIVHNFEFYSAFEPRMFSCFIAMFRYAWRIFKLQSETFYRHQNVAP